MPHVEAFELEETPPGKGAKQGSNTRLEDIEIIEADGTSHTFTYISYDGMVSEAPRYQQIVLYFATARGMFQVTVKGDNLGGLHGKIMSRQLRQILPVDSFHAKVDGSGYSIESVVVEEISERDA